MYVTVLFLPLPRDRELTVLIVTDMRVVKISSVLHPTLLTFTDHVVDNFVTGYNRFWAR